MCRVPSVLPGAEIPSEFCLAWLPARCAAGPGGARFDNRRLRVRSAVGRESIRAHA